MSKKLLDLEILYPSHSIKSILEIGTGFCVKKLKVPFPSTFLKILNESLIILCGGLNKKKLNCHKILTRVTHTYHLIN